MLFADASIPRIISIQASDEAMVELRRLQSASADAWTEMTRGMEASAKSMQEAFERARRSFDKK